MVIAFSLSVLTGWPFVAASHYHLLGLTDRPLYQPLKYHFSSIELTVHSSFASPSLVPRRLYLKLNSTSIKLE